MWVVPCNWDHGHPVVSVVGGLYRPNGHSQICSSMRLGSFWQLAWPQASFIEEKIEIYLDERGAEEPTLFSLLSIRSGMTLSDTQWFELIK